jgi:hypothetical protein
MSEHDSTCALSALPIVTGVQFRFIPGWARYAAGDDGSIWSSVSGAWKKLRPNPAGRYATVGLCEGGKARTIQVHALILLTFVGPRPEGMVGAHRNGNARDCSLANLRYGTQKSNIADKREHGTHLAGVQLSWTKLSESDVREIRRLIGTATLKAIGERLGITRHQVASIRDGKSWSWLK